LAGVALGCAIVFSQKALAFAGLVAVGTALALWRDRAAWVRAARGAAAVLACAIVPLGAAAFAVHRAGYWSDLVFWNYTFNRYLYLQDPRLEGPSAFGTLAASAGEAPLLWIAGLAGLALAIRRPRLETTIAAVVVAGLTAVLFSSRFPFGHNLLLLQPCLALLAVPILDAALASERFRQAASAAVLLMVGKTAVLGAFYTEVPDAPAVQTAALASTSPQDPVAIAPPYNPIFRKDAFYFWVEPGKFVPAYLECCARGPCPEGKAAADARAWSESPPVAVFAPAGEPTWRPWGWAEHRSDYREAETGLWLRSGPTSVAGAATPSRAGGDVPGRPRTR
jgi:hypothetical protein